MRLRRFTTRVTNLQVNGDEFQCSQPSIMTIQAFETLIGPHESFDWPEIWPKVKTLYWITPPDHLQFLSHFLTLNVRTLRIHLEQAEDEEVQEVLGLVESRCMNLVDLRLVDPEEREDEEIQDTIRQIIYNNSLTLKVFYPPQDPPAPLVSDILKLPMLQVLDMHIPEVPDSAPWDILPSLEYINFTLDDPSDTIRLLGTLRESKLRHFSLTCPYPTSDDEHAAMADFFNSTGLYFSADEFSWELPSDEKPPTWQFVKTLSYFSNMQVLSLGIHCTPACCFGFRHQNVVELSTWMPRLRELYLGGSPCAASGRVTDIGYHTLAVLAKNCPKLFSLTIHFNIGTFVFRDFVETNWNVTVWDVGDIPPPSDPQILTMFALAVSSLFPKVTFIGAMGKNAMKWNEIYEELQMFTLPTDHKMLDLM